MCLGIIRIYPDCLTKIILSCLIATKLAKSRPKIVERIGSMRIELEQLQIKRNRLGIGSLSEALIALSKEKLGIGRVGSIHRRSGEVVAEPWAALIQREKQEQSLRYIIGYLSFNAGFEPSPFEGIRKILSLVDI